MKRSLYSWLYVVGFLAILILVIFTTSHIMSALKATDIAYYSGVVFATSLTSYALLVKGYLKPQAANHILISKILSIFLGICAFLAATLAALTSILMARSGQYDANQILMTISSSILIVSFCIGPALIALVSNLKLAAIANK